MPSKLPLAFEPNQGRTDARVRFLARGAGYRLFLTGDEAVLGLGETTVLRTRLVGARRASVIPEARLPGIVNSYTPGKVRTRIPTYSRVRYRNIYPATDLVWHGDEGQLEYDFVLRPGASPRTIVLRLLGAQAIRLDRHGDLSLRTTEGVLSQPQPYAYQETSAGRRRVPVRYDLDGRTVRLRVGAYDRTRPLVIDPKVVYESYLGGSASERGEGIALAANGDAYLTGMTFSTSDFPTTNPELSQGVGRDAFVTRLNAAGNARIFSTYWGGSGEDWAHAIAIDGVGGVYVTGHTKSTDYPKTDGSTHKGTNDYNAFFVKFTDAGGLVYSGELGGVTFTSSTSHNSIYTSGLAIAADSGQHAYVVGSTNVSDLTGANNALADINGDAFVMKLSPGADDQHPARTFVRYVGGNSIDEGYSVALNGANAYVAGSTFSNNIPGAVNSNAGGYEGYVAKVKTDGTALDASRYVGGTGQDFALDVAVDGSGNTFLAGTTTGSFPTTSGVVHETPPVLGSGWAAKLNPTFATLTYSTYVGGGVNSIAIDSLGNAYLGGSAPIDGLSQVNPIQPGRAGANDGFVAKLKADGSAWVYSSYVGGTAEDQVIAIATGPAGSAAAIGYAFSNDLPTEAPIQPALNGVVDAFMLKLAPEPARIDSGPSGPVASADATFAFSTEDDGTTFKCGVDGPNPPSSSCTSPKSFPGLAQGSHTFRVQAFDAGGSSDGTVTTRTFQVDTVAPTAPALQEPADASFLLSLSPSLQWAVASDAAPASGISRYDLVIDGAVANSVDPAACTGSCTATPAAPLSEGSHTWLVLAVDAAGNTTSSSSRTFTSAATPTASLLVSPNPALVGRDVTLDGSGSSANGGTLTKFEWDLDGDGSFETDTGTTNSVTRTYTLPGSFKVQLRVTTLTSQTAVADSALIITDPTASAQFGVSINNGAQYTRTPNVTVTTTFPPAIKTLLFSNDGGFFAPTEVGAQRETRWKLDSSGPERLPKIVYVRFMNGPIVAQTLTDDIILDETPPRVDQASVTPAAGAAVVRAAKVRKWVVKVRASDSNSGVSRLQVTSNKRKPGKLLAYRKKLTVKSARRPAFVRARDRAGNFSRWRKAR